MGSDVIPEICEQIRMVPKEQETIDLLIVSNGGDPIVAWRIIGLLRERFRKIGVLVPFSAQSSATILAFGADEILMHPFSCLGPIDPQITTQAGPTNPPAIFSVEDIRSYIDFISQDLKLEDPGSNMQALQHLVSELKPTTIGMVKKSMKLSESLASKLLSLHMDSKDKIDEIVEKYNNLSHHGYTVSRKEAKESGLPVEFVKSDLEDIMWNIWADIEEEMRCREPFHPMKSISRQPDGANKLNEAMRSNLPFSIKVIEEVKIAVVESKYLSSSFGMDEHITATRNGPSVNYAVEGVPAGWIRSNIYEENK